MPAAPIWVNIEGAGELRALSRRLKDAGRGDLQRELRQQIRDEGKPVIRDLRRAAMAVDVSSTRGGRARPRGSTNLRARTAKATGLSTTQNGILIRTRGRRVDAAYPTLPKYLDSTLGRFDRWRHPVFGHMDVWTQQRGEPWFFVTVRRHARAFRRAVFDAIRSINDKIAS